MLNKERYLVIVDDEEGFHEPTDFSNIDRAKALALSQLAYGYACRVIDVVTGAQVFPKEEQLLA